MPQPLWDASALVKRYDPEQGSDTVDTVFGANPAVPMATTYLVYAETCDAALLFASLRLARQAPPGLTCALVAADQRLIRAAELERLAALDPDFVSAADVPALLASL